MLNVIRLGFVAMLAGVLVACAPGHQEDTLRYATHENINISPNDNREYRFLQLENGLQVLVVSDMEAEKSAAALAVKAGSMQNPDEQLGLAHYLEHMLFLGTEKYPDPDEYGDFMSVNGGMHNAYTADDHTNYMLEVNNDALPEALDRFSDFFKAPMFYPDYSEKEVNAVDSEWSMRRASDGYILFALSNLLMNPEHPIARFRIGNSQTLSDKEGSNLHEEMLAFYERYYSANLMTASVVGAYSLDELEQLAREAFSDVPNRNAEAPEINEPAVTDTERGVKVYYKPQMDLRMVFLDFTIPNNLEQFRNKPNELVGHLIRSEMPGTPAAFFRDMGWIDSISAGAQPNAFGNAGRFRITVNVTESGMPYRDAIVGVLLDYLETIRVEGVDPKYVDEARTVLNNEFRYLERTGAFGYATSLAANLLYYAPEHVIDHQFILASYDADAVEEVLSHLTPDNLRLWYISRNETVDQEMEFFDGEYRVEPITAADHAKWAMASEGILTRLPDVNQLLPEDLDVRAAEIQGKPELVLHEGGKELWLKNSDYFEIPRASVTLNLFKDTEGWPLEDRMARSVLNNVYSVYQRPLSQEASVAGVNFSFNVGSGITMSLSGFSDTQARLAERLLAEFRDMEVSEAMVAQAVDRIRRGYENQRRQFPMQQMFPAFNKMMYAPHTDNTDELAALEQVTVEQVMRLRDAMFDDVTLRALVIGNYTRDEAAELVNRVANHVNIDESLSVKRGQYVLPKDGLVLNWQDQLELEDTAVMEAFLLEDESVKGDALARFMAELMHNRFFTELRTEDQLGYAVGATRVAVREHAGVAFYIQSPVMAPADLLARFERFRTEYADRLADMEAERIEQVRNSILTDLRQPPTNLREEAGRFQGDWTRQNGDFDSREKLIAAVEEVSMDEIKAFYNQLMASEGMARVVVQLRGTTFEDEPFGSFDGEQALTDFSDFEPELAR